MSRRLPNQKIVVAVVYVCGMLMNSLDSTIVNVALATLSRQFGVPPAATDAVVVGYLVSLAVFIPASGWLGDRFGTKRIFLLALAIFSGASALCGLAGSFGQLVAFRVLQGAGGGMLTPVGMAMLWRTYPPHERVGVSRILMFATIIGPASGPVVGGLLIEKLSWHWAFYVNVPVGAAAFLFGLLFLHEHREPTAGGFDLPGFLLAGGGFALLMYALSEGPTRGWTSPGILGCGVAGLFVLAAFVVVELRAAAPMVQLRLLGNRLFRSTLSVSLFASAGFTGILFLVPLFLQEARGDSPLASGLTTFPEALGVVVSTQLVARLYPRVGPRRLMAGGLVGVATAMALLCTISLESSAWLIRLLMFLIGVGMAYVFLPNQAASLATISRAATGRATTLSSVQRQIGSALGVATLSTVLAAVGPLGHDAAGAARPHLAAYRAAFLAAAAFATLGAALALKVPDRDAADTMRPRPGRRAAEPAPAALVPEGD
ncbi:MAG TPA: DHA2 family efflux MFS transporter permease subunit [Thermomicrobiales bacterium]|nr:DHA2 family efflux MFS transporter permease subunit [Thermomicrobiales bacterium]